VPFRLTSPSADRGDKAGDSRPPGVCSRGRRAGLGPAVQGLCGQTKETDRRAGGCGERGVVSPAGAAGGRGTGRRGRLADRVHDPLRRGGCRGERCGDHAEPGVGLRFRYHHGEDRTVPQQLHKLGRTGAREPESHWAQPEARDVPVSVSDLA